MNEEIRLFLLVVEEKINGQAFARCCPHVTQICRDECPELVKYSDDHQVACYHLKQM